MQGTVRSRGPVEDTERAWLPRCSVVHDYFEPVQVYRHVLLMGDIFVENVVGFERPEDVLL